MPTFCRHNRFIERCPICSKTLPGAQPPKRSAPSRAAGARTTHGASTRRASGRRLRGSGREVHVHRELRAADDGYANDLLPGVRASADAVRLAEEIAFAAGRLQRMHAAPPDLLGEIRSLALAGELERATWMCFLAVYLSPLQGEDPFAGVRLALERERALVLAGDAGEGASPRADGTALDGSASEGRDAGEDGRDWDSPLGGVPLDGVPLGPRTSHDPARGSRTVRAYRQWSLHAGSQAQALVGESSWSPERRFARAFERLALPGFPRAGRYELLVTFGRLGLYELRADALHLAGGRSGGAGEDLATLGAKRVLAVGEPVYLERRAIAFARELDVPLEALDLAFANWAAGERATLGFKDDALDHHTLERVSGLLGL